MMNIHNALVQARKGFKETINNNGQTITIYRKALIDNGLGVMVTNPSAAPATYTVKGRISHESEGTFRNIESTAGIGSQFDRYILVSYKYTILENDEFTDSNGDRWRIGPVDPLIKFCGVIGYQAPLFKAVTA